MSSKLFELGTSCLVDRFVLGKWIVSAMRSCYQIIAEKLFVLIWMCDLIALTQCCKLISFLHLI